MFAKLCWFLGYLGLSFSLLTAHSFARACKSLELLVNGFVRLIGQPTYIMFRAQEGGTYDFVELAEVV